MPTFLSEDFKVVSGTHLPNNEFCLLVNIPNYHPTFLLTDFPPYCAKTLPHELAR